MLPKRNRNKELIFKDHPEFKPNLTPYEIFALGSFGGTYWRPIYSTITKKGYKDVYLKYPELRNLPQEILTRYYFDYNKDINKYKVKVGSTLLFWEKKGWITRYHPYGWVQWYCDFYHGIRTPDDRRQINRWLRTAGPKSRFRLNLINQIKENKTKYNNYKISPKIRQTLQHWAYKLNKKDFDEN